MTFDRSHIDTALSTLGALLEDRGEHFEVVAVGGGNLILAGLISRPVTKDLDLVGRMTERGLEQMSVMPARLSQAVSDVGLALGLAEDWMNIGPQALLDLGLPAGFEARLRAADYGGLVVWMASRFDMICFKLYAAADQGVRSYHLRDLRELEPSIEELTAAARWTRTHDPSPGFRQLLMTALDAVRPGAGDAVE
jgi:hypothetical protein